MLYLLSGLEYFYYIGIPVIAVCLIILLIVVFVVKSKHENQAKINEALQQIIEAFGGKNNIQSIEAKGSRLSLSLIDYSLLDEVQLKNNGVTSIIKMSNKITLVIGEQAKEIENYVNQK